MGNVEPSGLFSGNADVVVTDGFIGNILLKSSEAISNVLQNIIKKELGSLSLSPEQMQSFFRSLSRFSTKNPEYAGAPLLGVDGTCIIAHGGSKAATIKHCIALADRFQKSKALEFMKTNIDS
jgi:glycerol-3-phosphate acyltransferase PlsX